MRKITRPSITWSQWAVTKLVPSGRAVTEPYFLSCLRDRYTVFALRRTIHSRYHRLFFSLDHFAVHTIFASTDPLSAAESRSARRNLNTHSLIPCTKPLPYKDKGGSEIARPCASRRLKHPLSLYGPRANEVYVRSLHNNEQPLNTPQASPKHATFEYLL